MASNERFWDAYAPALLTANGTLNGIVAVSDTFGLYTWQKVSLKSNTQTPQTFEIKQVLNDNLVQLGPVDGNISTSSNLTAFLLIDVAEIKADRQQKRVIKPNDQEQASWAHEPINARRVVQVDDHGDYYKSVTDSEGTKRFPVDAAVTVTGISVDLDALTPATRPDPDNVLIAGSEDGTKGGLKHAARVDAELDLRVGISDGVNKATVNGLGQLSVQDSDAAVLLASIDAGIPASLGQTTMANSMPVTIASNQPPIPVTAVFPDEPMKISGTIDGTPTGTEYGFVYNIRQQILAAHDRTQDITYADFGTKNQRITQIDYASATFIGVIARKVISYTLVGNNYRRDSIDWVII